MCPLISLQLHAGCQEVKVIFNILQNWHELFAYFRATEGTLHSEARNKARELGNMLADDINYLYMVFVSPIVTKFERLNALFQSKNVDPEKLMDLHYMVLHPRVRQKWEQDGLVSSWVWTKVSE